MRKKEYLKSRSVIVQVFILQKDFGLLADFP